MLALLLMNRMTMKRRAARKQTLAKPSKAEAKVPEVVYCRTCLGTEDLESIFLTKELEKKRSHELRLVTGLQIKMNDGLSQKICGKCIDTMNVALQFRRASRKAEKTLLGMARKTKKKKLEKKVPITSNTGNVDDSFDYSFDAGMDFQNDGFDDDGGLLEEMPRNTVGDGTGVDGSEAKSKTTLKPVHKTGAGVNTPPFTCPICNKEFRMKATCKTHIRFHTNYCICETCGKRCRNNNQLQEHKRARHGLGRIHKCAYCEYSSATKEALTIHERRHTGERPYVCDHCGATFHRRSNLVQHIAIHLPEKNFQCTKCGKREKSLKRVRVHEYKAHKSKAYRFLCPACGAAFARPYNARKHLARCHSVSREDQGPIQRVDVNSLAHVQGVPTRRGLPTEDAPYLN